MIERDSDAARSEAPGKGNVDAGGREKQDAEGGCRTASTDYAPLCCSWYPSNCIRSAFDLLPTVASDVHAALLTKGANYGVCVEFGGSDP